MKGIQLTVHQWFDCWSSGNFHNIPVTDNFQHTSPYGIISGKKKYLDLVELNLDKFLGYKFEIHDGLYQDDTACVRYTARKKDFELQVSEWYRTEKNLIKEIFAYYSIPEQVVVGKGLKGLE